MFARYTKREKIALIASRKRRSGGDRIITTPARSSITVDAFKFNVQPKPCHRAFGVRHGDELGQTVTAKTENERTNERAVTTTKNKTLHETREETMAQMEGKTVDLNEIERRSSKVGMKTLPRTPLQQNCSDETRSIVAPLVSILTPFDSLARNAMAVVEEEEGGRGCNE